MTKKIIDFSEKQRKDFASSLLETIKAFFQKVFKFEKPLHGKELNDYLLSQTESEEERETLQEMFEENETYHNKLKEFEQSGKKIDEWYEAEIEKAVKQIDPAATPADIDKVKEAVAKQIDDEIEHSIDALEIINTLVDDVNRKEATL